MANRTEGHFQGHDSTELFYQTWLQENPKGTLVVTHGLSEHSECYKIFAEGIQAANWDIYAWDMRGHGRSDGKRGLVTDFSDYCRDLNIFINHVQRHRQSPENPLVLLGHSMGGLVTSRTLIDFPQTSVKAFCLSSPAFGISMPVPQWKEKSAYFLARWLPKVTLNNEIHYERLSHDEEILKSYPKDPLRHDKISPRLFLGMTSSFEYALNHAEKINQPMLLQLSGSDAIVDASKAELFFDRVASTVKEKHIYSNSFHEIFNDVERPTVFSDLMNFLKKVENL